MIKNISTTQILVKSFFIPILISCGASPSTASPSPPPFVSGIYTARLLLGGRNVPLCTSEDPNDVYASACCPPSHVVSIKLSQEANGLHINNKLAQQSNETYSPKNRFLWHEKLSQDPVDVDPAKWTDQDARLWARSFSSYCSGLR